MLVEGKLVKLPEWIGFWYLNKVGELKAFTAEGRIEEPYIGKYKDRLDWEETNGLRSYGGMMIGLLAPSTLIKKVTIVGNELCGTFELWESIPEDLTVKRICPDNRELTNWHPTGDELMSNNYLVWSNHILDRKL